MIRPEILALIKRAATEETNDEEEKMGRAPASKNREARFEWMKKRQAAPSSWRNKWRPLRRIVCSCEDKIGCKRCREREQNVRRYLKLPALERLHKAVMCQCGICRTCRHREYMRTYRNGTL